MEELQESDMFTYTAVSTRPRSSPQRSLSNQNMKRSKPIDIPRNKRNWKLEFSSCRENTNHTKLCVSQVSEEEEDEEDYGVPPHVMVSRRLTATGKIEFSVCSGQGRTLKGRDLSYVRDSILRMTGFLES
ncbi:hypothetical protein QJS10_CPB20g01748 [Acorus calamus]|uniref:Senescence regulator S40 n=1 Tax=Acorus calamus TaxID=4465 RepID=A0AAV9C9S4_ACOCL|nr:hypothetical protein QJS10_CPB20g01748 [Acorus calamus]